LRRLAMGLERVRSARVPSFATGSAIYSRRTRRWFFRRRRRRRRGFVRWCGDRID
jgi:hypothetical protein